MKLKYPSPYFLHSYGAPAVAAMVCAAFAAMAIVAYFHYAHLVASSALWPVVDGRVTLSQTYMQRLTRNGSPILGAHFSYAYRVAGHDFTSDVYSYGETPLALNLVSDHPAGSQVTVHYNPQNASQAVIDPSRTDVTCLFAGVWLGGLALAFLVIPWLLGR